MDTSVIYNFFSDIFWFRNGYKLSVLSESGVKMVIKCCQVLLCPNATQRQSLRCSNRSLVHVHGY